MFGVGNSQWAQTYQAFPQQVALGLVRAGATQAQPLCVADVDTADWAESFDEWQRDIIVAMLSTFYVAPPATYSGADRAALSQERMQLRLMEPSEPGKVLTVDEAVEAFSAAADAAGGTDDRLYMLKV